MKPNGEPERPQFKAVSFHIRFTPPEHAMILRAAQNESRSVAQFVRLAALKRARQQ